MCVSACVCVYVCVSVTLPWALISIQRLSTATVGNVAHTFTVCGYRNVSEEVDFRPEIFKLSKKQPRGGALRETFLRVDG